MQDLGGEVQQGPKKTEEILLTIENGVDGSAPTRGGLVDADKQITIKNMWVLQLEATDDRKIRYTAQGEAISGTNQFRVKLLDSSFGEKWNIIVVVNSNEGLESYVGQPFSKFASTGRRVETGSADAPIIISHIGSFTTVGIAVVNGNTDISINRYMAPLSVSLLRAVAKVDIGVGTYNAKNNTWSNSGANKIPFTLSSVQLRGSKLKVRWYFNIDADTFDPLENAVKKASPEGQGTQTTNPMTYKPAVNTEPYITNTIYMWESTLSGSRYDENHLNRPRLIIGGKYEDGPITYYRLDFSGLDGGSKDFFTSDILRNHLYRFTINSVSGPGQDTPDKADETVPAELDFSTAILPWSDGVLDNPHQQIGYYMNYGGLNGLITTTPATGDIPIKAPYWRGRQWLSNPHNVAFDYNTFYGEADNYWAHMGEPGQYNGDLYATANGTVDNTNYIFAALKTEGVYPTLLVASNNITDLKGNSNFAWKTGRALTAFDMCRNYNGGGYGDWRLPRLSELALMYANRADLEALSGFEPFGENAVYWSGSEYGTGKQDGSSKAWAFRFSTTDVYRVEEKSTKHLIRCVRQP